MKHIVKIIGSIFILLMISMFFIFLKDDITHQNISYATSSRSTDIQLMARAINGEARGEPYEGQVAVRCSYFKPSKKLKISKHNSRSYI